MFLLNILKYLFNLHFNGKSETELRNLSFLSFFNDYNSMIYANVGNFKDLLKQDPIQAKERL